MNVKQLREILDEYPPSMKLKVIVPPNSKEHWDVGGEAMLETTVIETIIKLMEHPDPTMTIFGCYDCIVRERVEMNGRDTLFPANKMWLELDLR